MKYSHALVTGGAGLIGSHIAQLLLSEGLSVTIVDNLSVGKAENIPAGARFVKGDVRDLQLMKELAKDAEIVFHEAAKVGIRASFDECYEDAETNLMGTINMLRACRDSRVKKFIYASSMAVYADSKTPVPITEDYAKDPIAPYGVAKLASEQYCMMLCKSIGIDAIALRYFNTFGPRQTFTPYVGVITIFINRLLAGEPPVIFGDGNQLRDFIYVGDIARANILAMKADVSGEIMNVGTGIGTNVNQIAQLLISHINPGIAPSYAEQQAGELKISVPDISKAARLIGYAPQWTLQEKVNEVIEYIRGQK